MSLENALNYYGNKNNQDEDKFIDEFAEVEVQDCSFSMPDDELLQLHKKIEIRQKEIKDQMITINKECLKD